MLTTTITNNKNLEEHGLSTKRVINHFLLLKRKGYNENVFDGFPTLLETIFYACMHVYKELANQLFCA